MQRLKAKTLETKKNRVQAWVPCSTTCEATENSGSLTNYSSYTSSDFYKKEMKSHS